MEVWFPLLLEMYFEISSSLLIHWEIFATSFAQHDARTLSYNKYSVMPPAYIDPVLVILCFSNLIHSRQDKLSS